jgi:Flp pilus assembly protein TadB
MARPRIRRRPDGLIELRRRRLRDDVLVSDTARLLVLLLGCTSFLALLTAALVVSPVILVAAAAFALPAVWACLLARAAARLTHAPGPAPAPPPNRAA